MVVKMFKSAYVPLRVEVLKSANACAKRFCYRRAYRPAGMSTLSALVRHDGTQPLGLPAKRPLYVQHVPTSGQHLAVDVQVPPGGIFVPVDAGELEGKRGRPEAVVQLIDLCIDLRLGHITGRSVAQRCTHTGRQREGPISANVVKPGCAL